MLCMVCGLPDCAGEFPVRLTAEQLKDIGVKPEDIKPGGTIQMADQQEPQGRYPKVDPDTLPKGAKHGYIGSVEVYDANDPGHSNVTTGRAATSTDEPIVGTAGTIRADDSEDTPDKPSKATAKR